MWAMIGTSIALSIWTTGLMWMSAREEKRRLIIVEERATAKEETLSPPVKRPLDEKV